MTDFLNKFKIPTILGLGIIVLGLFSGLFLVLKEQILTSKATPDLTPQNITITNITDNSITISWQTKSPDASFITFGQNNASEQTVLDDRDTKPVPHLIHYVTLKNLLPQTHYQYKIISGKISSEIKTFETAKTAVNQTIFTPIIGSALDENGPINDGVVYLLINNAVTQSALIKTAGNFLIPLSSIRTEDLSQIFPLADDLMAKIIVISDKGSASINFELRNDSPPFAPLKLGQNLDLTEKTPASNSTQLDLSKYDLNGDGKVNSADNSIILQNIGKNEQKSQTYKKADINKDGLVDQKDLDLISQKLKQISLPETY